MAAQFDEAFYRNKRAALLSSFILILANAFAPHITKDAPLYIFRIDSISDWEVIFVGLLVCLYLNFAYLLHYRTEVPAWRRSPETGLQEVEALRESLDGSVVQSESERKELVAVQKDMGNHLEVLSSALRNFVASDFPQKLEYSVRVSLGGKPGMNELSVLVFNQLSAAIRKDPIIAQTAKDHLKWDVLTKQIIDQVADRIVGTFDEQYKRMLESCRNEIERHMVVTKEGLESLARKDDTRLAYLGSLLERNRKTESELHSWVNAMNLRVRAHYLYLPIILFVVASAWSILTLCRKL